MASEGHLVHNRLTHSLKVAQVGRRLAEYLVNKRHGQHRTSPLAVDPDVVETACLAHDLGHPPFGHHGEDVLNGLVKAQGLDGFEGNAQSFRIVAALGRRSHYYQGLDLTRASLNAILKYPWGHERTGYKSKKWGFYESEKGDFDFARKASGLSPGSKSAEAEIMDWADDVTYAVHDVEDFFRAGFIPLDRLVTDFDTREDFLTDSRVKASFRKEKVSLSLATDLLERWARQPVFFHKSLRQRYKARQEQSTALHRFSARLIGRFLNTESSGRDEPVVRLVMGRSPRLEIPEKLKAEVTLMKCLPQVFVFDAPSLAAGSFS